MTDNTPPTGPDPDRRLDTSRVRGILPARGSRGFSTHDLRGSLSGVRMRLSRKRRIAATIPLIAAMASYFVIPSYASNFSFDKGGNRVQGVITSSNGWGLWSDAVGGYRTFAAGYTAAGYWELSSRDGGGVIRAYCVQLSRQHNSGDVLHDAGAATKEVAFIESNFYPATTGVNQLADTNHEAAAVQLAIWGFTDGALNHPVQGPWPADVVTRAHNIYGWTQHFAPGWWQEQLAQPKLTLVVNPTTAQVPGDVAVTAHVAKPDGSVASGNLFAPGLQVRFSSTGGAFSASGAPVTQTVNVDGNGNAVVHLWHAPSGSAGDATVRADLVNYVGHTAGLLVPNNAADQNLAYPTTFPKNASATAVAHWTAPTPSPSPSPTATPTPTPTPTPKPVVTPTIHKSIEDVTSGAKGDDTHVVGTAGDTVKFVLEYANTGNGATADGSTVTDDLSQSHLADLTNVTLDGGSSHTLNGHVATWVVGSIAAGGKGTVSFTGTIPAGAADGAQYCNVGTLTPGGGNSGGVPSNQVCITVTSQPKPHLTSSKLVDDKTETTATVGQTLHYAISTVNDGNRDLTNVTVTDVLKGNGLDILANVTAADGGSFDSSTRTVTWTIASLKVGQSVSDHFTADVPTSLPGATQSCFVNVATAAAGAQGGFGGVQSTTNQTHTCATPPVCNVPSPQITITGPSTFTPGETAQYTVVAKNGSVAQTSANAIVVSVPGGFQVTTTSPVAVLSGQQATFTFPTLAAGEQQTLTVDVQVPANQPAGNATATAVMTSTENSDTVGCPHPSASVTANTTGTVTPVTGSVQGITNGTIQASSPAITTPETGAGGTGLLRTSLIGFLLMLSGAVVLTGLRRNPHAG